MPPKKVYKTKYTKIYGENPKGYAATRKFPKQSKKVSMKFRKKVQRVIDENNEDKQVFKQISDVNYNSAINNTTDCNFIIPNMTNSTFDNGRVGDQVRAKRLHLQGHLITNLLLQDYNSCRIGVRMLIVQPRNYGSLTLIQNGAATWMNFLLKRGGGTSGFTGIVSDLYTKINSDAIICYYDKLIYMQSPYVVDNKGALNIQRMTHFFDIKLKVKNKLLRYDVDIDGGLTPTEYNPVLILGYAHLNNGTPDTIETQLNMSWVSYLDYQDA